MNLVNNIPEYILRRSARRRTIEIQVRPESVRVLAPTRVTRGRIDRFVAEKAQWITERQQALRSRMLQQPAARSLDQGSDLLWLGERLNLKVREHQSATAVTLNEASLCLALSRRIRKPREAAIKEQLELWYREQATRYFHTRVRFWSAHMRLMPAQIKVRSYRRKWGCCNSRGEISFNWLLIMAPVHIIDYVIVHELSHLQQMNHSPAFWSVVVQYYPDYREAKRWLDRQGSALQWPPIGAAMS